MIIFLRMVTINYVRLKETYKILWLRYIYGVDLSQHCMKSLLGHNDPRVRGYKKYLSGLNLENARWYYLCGVEKNWRWEKNLHLAFVESEGSEIKIDNDFMTCHISNARQIKFDDSYIDWSLPHANDKYYNTCRNWWFANMIAKQGAYQKVEEGCLF